MEILAQYFMRYATRYMWYTCVPIPQYVVNVLPKILNIIIATKPTYLPFLETKVKSIIR